MLNTQADRQTDRQTEEDTLQTNTCGQNYLFAIITYIITCMAH